MGRWEMVKIGDAFLSINNGASIKQGDDVGSGLPITRIETISDSTVNRNKMGYAGIIDSSKFSNYILNTGDILMSHINSVKHLGKTALYERVKEETIIHGMNLLRFQTNRSKLDSKYANYFFNSYNFRRQLPRITKNSVNQSSFNVNALKELSMPLPPLQVQQQIADVLDRAGALIEKRKTQIDKLDLLVKSQFIEMFGDPVTNPKEWDTVTIGDLATKIRSGLSRKLSNDDIGVPVIRSTNMINGYLDTRDIKYWYLDDPQGADVPSYFLKDGDILVNFINSNEHIGKICIYNDIGRDCIYTTNIFVLNLNNRCNTIWFNQYAMTFAYKYQLKNIIQPAVNQSSFTTVNYRKMRLPLPSLSLQNEFASFVEQVEKYKVLLQESLSTLERNYKALMQKCFRGELF